jgi:G3E family GTPase
VQGTATLESHAEAVRQIAVADDIIVTKSDIGPATGALLTRLRRINPGARLVDAAIGRAPPADGMIGGSIYDPTTKVRDVLAWLNAEAYESSDTDRHHDDHRRGDGHRGHDVTRHDAHIGSFCLVFDAPLDWEHVAHWLDALVIAHGDDLLRVKGILNIAGRDKPIVVQAVQRLFHPPFELGSWPEGDTRSRIVFITRDLASHYVKDVLTTIQARRMVDAGSPSAAG